MYNLAVIFTAILGMTQGVSAACTNPTQRKAWSKLTNAEKSDYLNATLCLMDPVRSPSIAKYSPASSTAWGDLQVAHVAQVQFVHTVGAFLPWHRYFMTVHEKLLRDNCGFAGPLPYWDEQADEAAGPLTNASIWGSDPTTSFGTGAADANGCLVDGPFTKLTYSLDYQLEKSIVDACNALESYEDFNNCLGSSPHVSGHYAIGGTMQDVALSPADPLFFMHHTNLDRIWWEWQSQNASRLTDMGGPNVATATILSEDQPKSLPAAAFVPYFGDNGNFTTLEHVLWMTGLAENITIGEVMDIKSDAICVEYV